MKALVEAAAILCRGNSANLSDLASNPKLGNLIEALFGGADALIQAEIVFGFMAASVIISF